MNNFIVYKHYTLDTNVLFYIGEGRPDRANNPRHRNRYWNFVVSKHGYRAVVVYTKLKKTEAEELESKLIKLYKQSTTASVKLTNLCDGPMFKSHWLVGKPKEMHPCYGKKRPNPKLAEWNRQHSGTNSPTYGLKRNDLAERNRLGDFKRVFKSVRCIETKQEFDSCKAVFAYFNVTGAGGLSRALKDPNKTYRSFHWEVISQKDSPVEQTAD